MNKHKMHVVAEGYREPGYVCLRCDNCHVSVIFERPVWYEIVINGDKRLNEVDKKWRVCRGNR